MKILILTQAVNSHSTERLTNEAEKLKVDFEVINPSDLYAFVSSSVKGQDRIYKRSREKSVRLIAKDFNAIIPRIAGGAFDHGAMIVKHLNQNMRIWSTATAMGLRIASNKLETCQVLSCHNIRVPKQVLAHQPTDYKELIDMVGGLPCIGKLQHGSLGDGVFILNNELAASTSLKSFEKLGADVVLQQFIDSGTPANDIRAFVIGASRKTPQVYAYQRFALDTDFRSNYSKSKLGEKIDITDEERQMAIDSSRALNLNISGVDIMRDCKDKDKPYVIEVNGCPGLTGIESVTGINIARMIIQYAIEPDPPFGLPTRIIENTVRQKDEILNHNPADVKPKTLTKEEVMWNEIDKLPHNRDYDKYFS